MKHAEIVVNLKYDGNGQLVGCKPETRRVDAVYSNGHVKDHVGDVWQVIEKNSKYYTVR